MNFDPGRALSGHGVHPREEEDALPRQCRLRFPDVPAGPPGAQCSHHVSSGQGFIEGVPKKLFWSLLSHNATLAKALVKAFQIEKPIWDEEEVPEEPVGVRSQERKTVTVPDV